MSMTTYIILSGINSIIVMRLRCIHVVPPVFPFQTLSAIFLEFATNKLLFIHSIFDIIAELSQRFYLSHFLRFNFETEFILHNSHDVNKVK